MTGQERKIDPLLSRVLERELSPVPRLVCAAGLAGAAVMTGGLALLWATEPAPLPAHTAVAFGVMIAIGAAWVVCFAIALRRRGLAFAGVRLAAAWIGLVACVAFSAFAVPVAIARSSPTGVATASAVSAALVAAAGINLAGAWRRRRRLLDLRDTLNDDWRVR